MKHTAGILASMALLVGVMAAQTSGNAVRVKADVWADNWFSFFLGEKFIKEDSIPITTERSFNSESFTFEGEYPLTLNFILKDFIQNDTGLEYIGTRRQQLGDGGFIAQFHDADTDRLIGVTDSHWSCLVIHKAPLDESCARAQNPQAGTVPCNAYKTDEPKGWKSSGFDASKWSKATLYTSDEVGPKGGFDSISWDPSAQFIWGPDLRKDNTVLCRVTIGRKN